MRSVIANFLSGTLALLFAIAFVFGARGVVAGDAIRLDRRGLGYGLFSQDGALVFMRQQTFFQNRGIETVYRRLWNPNFVQDENWHWRIQTDQSFYPTPETTILGFGYDHLKGEYVGRGFRPGLSRERTIFRVPMWFILFALGIWPGIRYWRRSKLHQIRNEQGLCLKCGFDLKGIYHHCPKCGTRAPIPSGFPVHSWTN